MMNLGVKALPKVTSIFDSIFTHANIKLSQIGPEVYEIIFAAVSPEGKEYTLENLKLFNYYTDSLLINQ